MKNRIAALLMACVLSLSLMGTALAFSAPPSGPTQHNPNGGNSITNPDTPSTPSTPTRPSTDYTPSDPSYSVTNDNNGKADNGTWTTDKTSAKKGDTVTITATPNNGYQVGSVTVKDANGSAVTVKDLGNNKYSFTMPDGKVTVSVAFTPVNPFIDVAQDAYYYDAVLWAVGNGITNGIGNGKFGPNDPCTRGQIVTFLWRAMGSPEVAITTTFDDVVPGSYYEMAVAWAVANGITNGTGNGKFSPNDPCTRAQAVTFLHRAEKTPAASGSSFNDVADSAYYASAVSWAVANGITNGTGNGRFSPDDTCTRGQIVTFLYRDMA